MRTHNKNIGSYTKAAAFVGVLVVSLLITAPLASARRTSVSASLDCGHATVQNVFSEPSDNDGDDDCDDTQVVTNVQLGGATVTSVALGASVNDMATVSGEEDTPSGTVDFTLFANGTCNGSGSDAGSDSLRWGVAYSNPSGSLNTAGDYSYQATYTGDWFHEGVVGSCEEFAVMPASPTISSTASPGVVVGGSISDSATLAGSSELTGSGTITFKLYGASAGCSGTPLYTKTVSGVTASGPFGSGSYTPGAAGSYDWVASFSGDANNDAVSGGCTDESVVIGLASPTISSTASPGVVVGGSISDSATLAGSSELTGSGTITFKLYGASAGCSGTPLYTKTVSGVTASGPFGSGSYTPGAAGSYDWVASFSGDANNDAVSGGCTDESVVIGLASPTISSTASPGVVVGGSISDSATLAGSSELTGSGTITFKLYGASAGCSGTPLYTKTVSGVTASGPFGSGSYTPGAAGSYDWVASFSGDANNDAVSGGCTDESVVIGLASPTISSTASPGVVVGGSISDSATLAGSSELTGSGTITFKLYGASAGCSGTPLYTKTVSGVTASGPFGSGSYTPGAAGSYDWVASFSGDANNDAVSGGCTDESVVIGLASPTISSTASPGVVVGGSISDSATLAGSSELTGSGTITFKLYGASAGCSGTPLYTKTVSGVTASGPFGSGSYTPGAAGSYDWVASFSGDANNKAANVACMAEPVVVSPAPAPAPLTAAISITETPSAQTIGSGDSATFTILVTNSGEVTLTGVTVADALAPNCNASSPGIAALASIAPGASVSYGCSLGAVTAGFANVVLASGTPPSAATVSASASASVSVAAPAPIAIVVSKPVSKPVPSIPSISISIAKDPKSQTIAAGGTATFTISVTNNGNVPLTDVAIADPLSRDCDRNLGSLDAGASRSYTCTRSGVSADFENSVTVTASPPSGAQVSAVAHATVTVAAFVPPEIAQIAIAKSPKLQKLRTSIVVTKTKDGATKTFVTYGSARFAIKVTNTGNTLLTDVSVADPFSPGCDRRIGVLAAGVTRSYGCSSSSVATSFTSAAVVTGKGPKGKKVRAMSHPLVKVLVKTARAAAV